METSSFVFCVLHYDYTYYEHWTVLLLNDSYILF